MKKMLFGLLVLFSMAFMGCDFSPAVAEVSIVNNTNYSFVFMANYNHSLKSGARVSAVGPNQTVHVSCEGIYTKSQIEDEGDDFYFYYSELNDWEDLKNNAAPGVSDWYLLTNDAHEMSLSNKYSQNYTVTFEIKNGSLMTEIVSH